MFEFPSCLGCSSVRDNTPLNVVLSLSSEHGTTDVVTKLWPLPAWTEPGGKRDVMNLTSWCP